ncbi:hypothetical protein F4X33_10500 [Candidatus Poribacteria bacterium]|nr:hypothetical protein [Candidatus Poribacteria bacterium]
MDTNSTNYDDAARVSAAAVVGLPARVVAARLANEAANAFGHVMGIGSTLDAAEAEAAKRSYLEVTTAALAA